MSLTGWTIRVVFDDPPYSDPAGWTYSDVRPYCDSLAFKRGRADEVAAIETGNSTANLDNNDGRFTPGRVASPYYPGVVPRRRIMASLTTNTATYDLFSHLVERWPCELGSGQVSDSNVPAVDSFKHLGGLTLRSVVEEETRRFSPIAHWPLTEGEGSLQAGNIVTGQPPAVLIAAKNGTAGGSVTAFGEPGLNDVMGTGLRLVSGSSNQGHLLELKPVGATFDLGLAAGWSVNVWMRSPVTSNNSNNYVFALHNTSPAGPVLLAELEVRSTGDVRAFVGDGVAGHTATCAVGLANTNTWQMWTMVLNDAKTQLTLYRNGVSVATSAVGGVINWTPSGNYPGRYLTGGNAYPGGVSGLSDFTLAHLSIHASPLTAAQLAGIYTAGVTGFSGETESARITRILDYIAWPAASRNIQTGLSPLLGADWAGMSALAAMQDAAFSADGVLFMSATDKVTYHNRHHRLSPTIDATFSADPAATQPVESPLAFTSDDTLIVNDITVTQRGGASVRRTNTASITAYGQRTQQVDVHVSTTAELVDRADWIISHYAEPVPRVEFARFRPNTAQALWDALGAREVGDRVRLAALPATAPATSLDFIVEAVEADLTESESEWRLLLSPASTDTYWILGDTTYGVLDSTTRLAY